MTVAGEDLALTLAVSQEEWNAYVQAEMDMLQRYYEQKYGSGSIVPVVLSEARYNLSREKALELYALYIDLAGNHTKK